MSERVEIVESGLERRVHRRDRKRNIRLASRAIKAWASRGWTKPERVEVLKIARVFRLKGVGFNRSDVVAKRLYRARDGNLFIEPVIYEKILPHLPISTLHYYGCIPEPDNGSHWLFVEDANGEKYSSSVERHRVLAAQWLGGLHTFAQGLFKNVDIPDRGPGHYLNKLRSTREIILDKLSNQNFKTDDILLLRSTLSQFDDLESQWDKIERRCLGMPRTLIHRDFIEKNLRVRGTKLKRALLCFDWEHTGLGVPAVDLFSLGSAASPDLPTYWSVVRDHWGDLDMEDVHALSRIGDLFRCIGSFSWASEYLEYEWAISRTRRYYAFLTQIYGGHLKLL